MLNIYIKLNTFVKKKLTFSLLIIHDIKPRIFDKNRY